MSEAHPEIDYHHSQTAKHALRRGILWSDGFILLIAFSILSTGRLGWMRGWIFLAVYILLAVATLSYLWRVNPEVIVARSAHHRDTKSWDKVLLLLFVFLFIAMFQVAAIDEGRFHWSAVPLWLCVAGYILLLIRTAGNVWVLSVNKFAELSVRIQTDRSQKVIVIGPYAIVRHPIYSATFFFYTGIPLALGSYWAFIPAAISVLLVIVRTALEDRMLQNELAGYKDYAARVRYRLVPGIW
ncbi:MAG: isoprenylcysteine carboxylmethyltransferase family protein [Thermoguttaceae bacterium]|jgi:protein-S-isoprenylcysteine O-methyltransferase Ste14